MLADEGGSSAFVSFVGAMSVATPVLETRGLTIRFGGHVAVNDVSCAFLPGSVTAIVGPNGAGKTTYFNLISGQLPASAGQVFVKGVECGRAELPLG
jgi:branched-chain amino acid transport system ATP-binding protein